MANNYDLSKLAVKMVCPTNELLVDDKDLPGVYVRRASKKLSELLNTTDTSVHPAFKIGGATKASLLFGKYQGRTYGNRLYSLPGEDPAVSLDLDTFTAYCRNKGGNHHEITAAEWAFLALLAKKNGTKPKGNNNYGKDHSESTVVAIPSYVDGNGTICRVATGTGPLSWSDTGDINGIFDLNGNVWEWIIGIRLVHGELQVIPYNDAAISTTNLSATSDAWRAINANATGWDDLFIVPNGSGTTANSVKLDFVGGHWQWQKSAITTKGANNAAFASTTIAADVSAFAALYLRAMALAPEEGDTDYDGDWFWANNQEAERCAARGGYWGNGSEHGVFALSFFNPRSSVSTGIGGRPASYE